MNFYNENRSGRTRYVPISNFFKLFILLYKRYIHWLFCHILLWKCPVHTALQMFSFRIDILFTTSVFTVFFIVHHNHCVCIRFKCYSFANSLNRTEKLELVIESTENLLLISHMGRKKNYDVFHNLFIFFKCAINCACLLTYSKHLMGIG